MAMYTEDTDYNPESRSLREDMLSLSEELTEAIGDLRESSKKWATDDNEMRKAKAKAFLKSTGKNKEEREANADASWEKERLQANLSEGERNADLERVRSLRAQLSALQSLIYASRAENDSIRYGQTQLS